MRIIYLLLLSLIASNAHAQKKIHAETDIQSVTVFSSGAQIQRTSTVAITPGRSEIVFSGLSNQLEQQSLQLKADAAITLLSVQVAKDFSGERRIEQEERSLIERRATLQEKIESDQKQLAVYKAEEEMLIKNQSIGGTTGVKADEMQKMLDLHRQRLSEVYQRQLETERRIRAQQQELQRTALQLGEISKKRDSINYSVVALIDSRETRSVNFQLLYTVKDAGWYPTYDLRVTDISQPLTVMMNANVFQRSGEAWKDINLFLSTGNPKANATSSQLQPWMLSFYDPSVAWMKSNSIKQGEIAGRITNERGEPVGYATITIKGTHIATTSDANGFFRLQQYPANGVLVISSVGYGVKEVAARPGYFTIALQQSQHNLSEVVVTGYGGSTPGVAYDKDITTRRDKEEIRPVTVAMEYQPTTVVYKIEDRYTLETNGKTTTIGIKKMEVPALYEYYSAPKIDAAAFLTAKIINWEEFDLQSGEASLYFEGTYLGKTYIDLSTTSDTLSLSLGRDNNVKVTRKLVKEFTSKKLIGTNRTESRLYEITVRNTKRVPINILLQDQFPVSVTKEIDVDDLKAADGKIDKESGLVTWNLTLKPGEERKVQISYTVKYPKDRRVDIE
jgi:hypothetical protein